LVEHHKIDAALLEELGELDQVLEQLAATLEQLSFELLYPELPRVARWAANGLTAYDAAYVAVAEQAGVQLITDDEQIVGTALKVATALGDVSGLS
jgi:predicted nucleic acid-binding protein